MVEGQITDPTVITVRYERAVTAGNFALNDFETVPANRVPDLISQSGANGLELEFMILIDEETALDYAGDVAGVLTPQTVPLTL